MDAALSARIQQRKLILDGIKEELTDRLQLEARPEEIDDDVFLFGGGLQLDSIDSMEIIIGMQVRFGADVPEGDMSALRTINTLADLVESQRN